MISRLDAFSTAGIQRQRDRDRRTGTKLTLSSCEQLDTLLSLLPQSVAELITGWSMTKTVSEANSGASRSTRASLQRAHVAACTHADPPQTCPFPPATRIHSHPCARRPNAACTSSLGIAGGACSCVGGVGCWLLGAAAPSCC